MLLQHPQRQGDYEGCIPSMHAAYNCESYEGIKEIGYEAFNNCTSLQCLVIPPAATEIHERALSGCSSLISLVFNDEIEEFVSAVSMREWWNRGVHE
jgi:hypothetical protein